MSRGSWGAILPFSESLHTDPIWRRCVAQPSRLPVSTTLLWRVIKAPVSLSKHYTLPECSRLQNSALTVTPTLPWAALIHHLGHTEAGRMALWIKICCANPLAGKTSTVICLPTQTLLQDFPVWLDKHSQLFPRRRMGLHRISGAGEGVAFTYFWSLWHHKAAEEEILLLTLRTLFLALILPFCHKMTILTICWIKQ